MSGRSGDIVLTGRRRTDWRPLQRGMVRPDCAGCCPATADVDGPSYAISHVRAHSPRGFVMLPLIGRFLPNPWVYACAISTSQPFASLRHSLMLIYCMPALHSSADTLTPTAAQGDAPQGSAPCPSLDFHDCPEQAPSTVSCNSLSIPCPL